MSQTTLARSYTKGAGQEGRDSVRPVLTALTNFPQDTRQLVLEIDQLAVSYTTRAGDVPAVTDFSLAISQGESVGLVGESGCGKSTVAMAIMRYLGRNGRMAGGKISFRGRDMASYSQAELNRLRGGEISLVYQEPFTALNPAMTIGMQLVEVPMIHQGLDLAQARERCLESLVDVRLPDPERIMGLYPHQLSGGQQQRVVVSMALLSKPLLLLCDEPTTALDVTVEAGIMEVLRAIRQKYGTSMLFISHNLGLVREVCDRVCVMYAGEVIEDGSVKDIFNYASHPYTRGLVGCIPLPCSDKYQRPLSSIPGYLPRVTEFFQGCRFAQRCDHFRPGLCDTHTIKLTRAPAPSRSMIRCARGHDIDWQAKAKTKQVTVQTAQRPGEIILHVDKMHKYYPVHDNSLAAILTGKRVRWIKANEDLNFIARKGQTLAIVGESGCGKSTIARVLLGLETATKGRIRLQNDDLADTPVLKRDHRQIGSLQMVFQNPDSTLNPSLSVGSQIRRVVRKFKIETRKLKSRTRVMELLDLVRLPRDFYMRKPRQLSGGQKQRVGIARAFAGGPSVVVADEPVSALDVSVQSAISQLLLDIQRQRRTTILFISHDLGLVRYLADRVVVMYFGQIMEQGAVEEIFEPPYHPYTEALLSAVPIADPNVDKKRILIEGNLPSFLNPPKGCPFAGRCQRKLGSICEDQKPPVHSLPSGHQIACHIPLTELQQMEPVFAPVVREHEAA